MGDRGGMPSTMAGDDGIPAVSLDQIRTLIMVLATISAAAALFVTLTYSIFLEKRRSSTGLLVLASAIAATAIEIDLSLAGYMTEELASNQCVALLAVYDACTGRPEALLAQVLLQLSRIYAPLFGPLQHLFLAGHHLEPLPASTP